MVVRTIILFLLGITALALTLLVTENLWVLSAVVTAHVVGSFVLLGLIVRQLGREEDEAQARERAEAGS